MRNILAAFAVLALIGGGSANAVAQDESSFVVDSFCFDKGIVEDDADFYSKHPKQWEFMAQSGQGAFMISVLNGDCFVSKTVIPVENVEVIESIEVVKGNPRESVDIMEVTFFNGNKAWLWNTRKRETADL